MSLFKRLFGLGVDSGAGTTLAAESEYEGFTITATPQPEGGQYRLHGTISKTVDGEAKTHILIRADLFPDAGQCAEVTIRKAKQVIDEQGDRLFA